MRQNNVQSEFISVLVTADFPDSALKRLFQFPPMYPDGKMKSYLRLGRQIIHLPAIRNYGRFHERVSRATQQAAHVSHNSIMSLCRCSATSGCLCNAETKRVIALDCGVAVITRN